ncbi:mitochondrial genome maintenance protein mgm101 [Tremella mesenterica]|uniref:Mitochondrial genome maintenance protein MGM101 n=1 Tax=Tremella mesenterica TaxID=5217 RepID=A0A4Q1BRC8_TREME|nr:mitochondrial genome maintenance protein mgm101 [Tremella mesenterica]
MSLIPRLSRTFSTYPIRLAAASPATTLSVSPRKYVRKTISRSNTVPKEDFPLPQDTPIEDYAHLSEVSPPLNVLPGEAYVPLPTMTEDYNSNPVPSSLATVGQQVVSGLRSTTIGTIGNNGLQSGQTVINGQIQGEAISTGFDWSTSFRGLSEKPFPKEVANELLKPLHVDDVEVKPDGLLYLPEIKYRRTLNAAFGPGGWGLAPRGETNVGPRIVSREWGLVCLGRLVAIARGEQEYFDPSGIPTATEACKSNALMRCCKDLGIASELWDPRFIRDFKTKHCVEVFVEHVTQKKKRKLWRKKNAKFEYPYKEAS